MSQRIFQSVSRYTLPVLLLLALLACKKLKGEDSEATPAAAPAAAYEEGPDGLKKLAQDLTTKDAAEAEALGKTLALPDAQKFFTETFGPELSGQLATDYAGEVGKLGTLHGFFKMNQAKGRTEVNVSKHTSPDDESQNGYQEAAIRAMKTPVALYTIRVVEPGKDLGSSLWSFAWVDGGFRYLGKLKPVKPDGTAFDELSKQGVKDALKGE
jgi:hypothetical protein